MDRGPRKGVRSQALVQLGGGASRGLLGCTTSTPHLIFLEGGFRCAGPTVPRGRSPPPPGGVRPSAHEADTEDWTPDTEGEGVAGRGPEGRGDRKIGKGGPGPGHMLHRRGVEGTMARAAGALGQGRRWAPVGGSHPPFRVFPRLRISSKGVGGTPVRSPRGSSETHKCFPPYSLRSSK